MMSVQKIPPSVLFERKNVERRYVFTDFAILGWMSLLALLAMGVDLGVNMGFHFGCHGELNKVVDTLEATPEADAVRGVVYNPDVTIEKINVYRH